jgi:hypothetical protein
VLERACAHILEYQLIYGGEGHSAGLIMGLGIKGNRKVEYSLQGARLYSVSAHARVPANVQQDAASLTNHHQMFRGRAKSQITGRTFSGVVHDVKRPLSSGQSLLTVVATIFLACTPCFEWSGTAFEGVK